MCSYLKGAREGDIITVESRPVKVGRRLAYTECELRLKSDGSIIARGAQTNFLGPKVKQPDNSE